MKRRQHGFTLVEILVVLGLLGVLMGLSVGFIAGAGRGNELIDAANRVSGLLTMASNSSIGNDRAYLSVEPVAGGGATVRAFVNQQVFHWACEDLDRASEDGILAKEGGVKAVDNDSSSREGRHVLFEGNGAVSLGNPGWLQMRDGFGLKCRVRPGARTGGSMTLFQKGAAFAVRLLPSSMGGYDLEVEVTLEPDAEGKDGGAHRLKTGFRGAEAVPEWQGPVLPGRWQDLRVTYDRDTLSVYVDEKLRATRDDRHQRLVRSDEPFRIGGGYLGGFDSLVISGIFEKDENRLEISPNVTWIDAAGKPIEKGTKIHFLNRALDGREHDKPVQLRFQIIGTDGRGPVRIVQVSLSGEIFVRSPGG
ncbi:MAG: prepilin-type N-terminal cleavage/methylation domain-containing protein [Planctomycetaceae bacterium]